MRPRTGIPQSFRSYSEFKSFVELLGSVGSFDNNSEANKVGATKICWDVRPHPNFNTLEVRISDIGTRVEETVCIVALVQAIVAGLLKLRRKNIGWRHYRRHHIVENKWRAMRYKIQGNLIDFGKAEEIPMEFLTLELIDIVDEVVDELGSREEVAYACTILKNDTSADRQLRKYNQIIQDKDGDDEPSEELKQQAMKSVVDQLVRETVDGIPDVRIPEHMEISDVRGD